ncbi:reverse transcriptase domain-containing protein [Metabacillus indicus]|uniref:reverse transcriptase domain-containing protein n=1 Tax=Metabacillus indicus TaxID=246786 RepID=UPI002A061FFE|nr:reverse transcriptase domain-containing protein [Metabacillus indicus]MDX8289111.1 reverse transcriptase domain-containing protein [Metabacillus indicus]
MNYFNAFPKLKSSDDEIRLKFSNLNDFKDLCNLLEITPTHLHYILFKKAPLYKQFTIPKKVKGERQILAPIKSLKILQQKLNYIFSLHYTPRFTTHGFAENRNVVTNAKMHLRKKNVLNFDLEDFFLSINFGRVRGVLINHFDMSEDVATVIANICCYNNQLPQGAPTSPILSNMVCYSMDKAMQSVAKQFGCTYTRYADDITFSTTKNTFPKALAYRLENRYLLGDKIVEILNDSSFKVNENKTRLLDKKQRMEVTGITVSEKLNVKRKYIRNIRAMLRSIELHGIEGAQEILVEKYQKKHMKISIPNIMDVIQGKINFLKIVRGENDSIYGKLARRYNDIAEKEVFDIAKNQEELRKMYTWVVEIGPMVNGEFACMFQGTGFFLKGVGFVTNAHVVESYKEFNDPSEPYYIRAHKSRYNPEYIPAELLLYNKEKDIAILKVDGYTLDYGFEYNTINETDQEIRVIGYPNHNKGDSLASDQGRIRQYRNHYMPNTYNQETNDLGAFQERFIVSARIVEGNSGGPVINSANEVIGIATKGFKRLSESGLDEDTEVSIAIKIEDVIDFASNFKQTASV